MKVIITKKDLKKLESDGYAKVEIEKDNLRVGTYCDIEVE